jgi:hypothetical protein
MFNKKPKTSKVIPTPVVVQEVEEMTAEQYETPEEKTPKKKEMPIEPAEVEEQVEEIEEELTDELVKNTFSNLSYRIGRIEHNLRLDF